MKALLTAVAALFIGGASYALPVTHISLQDSTYIQAHTMGLNWKVGDHTEHKLDMGFLQGSSKTTVSKDEGDSFWLTQDMDLGFAGKQKAEIQLDKATGAIKKILVNGKEQQVPKQNVEVISMDEAQITVPAGSYKCIHAKIKNKDNNEISEAWVNPQEIPIQGLLKAISPSQFGQVTQELLSFGRGN